MPCSLLVTFHSGRDPTWNSNLSPARLLHHEVCHLFLIFASFIFPISSSELTDSTNPGSSFSTATIVGLVMGPLAGVMLIAGTFWFYCRQRRVRDRHEIPSEEEVYLNQHLVSAELHAEGTAELKIQCHTRERDSCGAGGGCSKSAKIIAMDAGIPGTGVRPVGRVRGDWRVIR